MESSTTFRGVDRLQVSPLSRDAVAALAEPHGIDAEVLYEQTNGNPFFVGEVLAVGTGEIPLTVRDAVLARSARLSEPARRLMEAIAIATPQAEVWLLDALAPAELGRLEECLASGMVSSGREGVSFRHELARLAIEEALAPDRRVSLHRRAAEALAAGRERAVDPARIAHHADAAGDPAAVLRFAPAAAARAASLGAHREAAAQYARALRFSEARPPSEQAELLERRAFECYLTGEFDEAIAAQQGALAHRRALDDPLAEGDCLRSLSRLYRFHGRTDEAAEMGREAIARLEELPASRELAMAYVNLGHLYTVAEDADEALAWSSKALDLGERLGDTDVRVYALTNIGAVELFSEARGAPATLEQSLELALRSGLEENAGRAYLNLVWWPTHAATNWWTAISRGASSTAPSTAWICGPCSSDRAAPASSSTGAGGPRQRTWPPSSSEIAVRGPYRASSRSPCSGLVRARRGDPDVWPLLDDALALAEPTGELQRIGPATAARAEAAWLEGRPETIAE